MVLKDMNLEDLDVEIDISFLGNRWIVIRNYHSDDIPFGLRGKTPAMFTYQEYRLSDSSGWEGPFGEHDYSALVDILEKLDFSFSQAVSMVRMKATLQAPKQ